MRFDKLHAINDMWAAMPQHQCFLNSYGEDDSGYHRACILGWAAKRGMCGLSTVTNGWPGSHCSYIPQHHGYQGFEAANAVFGLLCDYKLVANLFGRRGDSKYDEGFMYLTDKQMGMHRFECFFKEYEHDKLRGMEADNFWIDEMVEA